MKFFNSVNFDLFNKPQLVSAKKEIANATEESLIDAYGVGAAMPADIVGFVFAPDHHIEGLYESTSV
ncbi:MAG TPA: hypothetical protein VGJ90_13465 [Methylophilaceae bacterium]|jgi:hypothetical protein